MVAAINRGRPKDQTTAAHECHPHAQHMPQRARAEQVHRHRQHERHQVGQLQRPFAADQTDGSARDKVTEEHYRIQEPLVHPDAVPVPPELAFRRGPPVDERLHNRHLHVDARIGEQVVRQGVRYAPLVEAEESDVEVVHAKVVRHVQIVVGANHQPHHQQSGGQNEPRIVGANDGGRNVGDQQDVEDQL